MAQVAVKPSDQLPAIGYIRVDEAKDGEIAAFLKDIAAYCLREGLRLTRCLVDQGYEGKELARPGIVDLREKLKDTSGLTVVVPTLDHLSPIESIRSPLRLMIDRLGGKLVVASERHDEAGS